MAVYEFEAENGEIVEVIMSFAEHEQRVKDDKITLDDGRTAKTFWNWGGSRRHRAVATCPGNWPHVSYAAGVHPSQVPEQMAVLKAAGVRTTHYTKDGDPVFEDRAHRKEVCEALGLFDRSGGYSDPQAKHVTRIKSFR